MTSATQEWTAIAPWPFSRIPPKDSNENNSLVGHNFMQYTQLFILLGRRNGKNYESIPFNELCLVVFLVDKGLGKNTIGKLIARRSGEGGM